MSEEHIVKMPGASSIGGIQALRDNLYLASSENSHIRLDASKVKKSDTATLQVLVALAKTLEDRGGKLEWAEPSPQITQQAKMLGVDKLIGLAS